ncbi:MAG: hypothetical protein ABI787_05870 [Spartobacteria bacterium]
MAELSGPAFFLIEMKAEARKALFSFAIELIVYGILVVAYFFLVLHFLGDWLARLNHDSVRLYALVAIGLIIGQAVVLESVTTLLLRLLRGRSE